MIRQYTLFTVKTHTAMTYTQNQIKTRKQKKLFIKLSKKMNFFHKQYKKLYFCFFALSIL